MTDAGLPYSYKTIQSLATESDARQLHGLYVSESIKHVQAIPASDIACLIIREDTAVAFDNAIPTYRVKASWFNRIKQTKHSQGVVAIIRLPTWTPTADYTHWIVCDTIQNPGNLGAIIRSVSAFLPNALVVRCGQGADAFHPDCVRASAGAVHQQPVVWLADTALPLDRPWYMLDPKGSAAINHLKEGSKLGIMLGSEGQGIRESLKTHCRPKKLRISITPHVESLNVAVTAGIVAYTLSPMSAYVSEPTD